MEFKYKDIFIGKLIETRVFEKELKEERICNFLKINEAQLHAMYQSKSMDAELLLRWSKLLEYDFFRIYSQHLVLYAPPARTSSANTSAKSTASTLPSFSKSLYTPEIIEFIVEQVACKKKTTSEIIEDYRIPKTTLYKWIKKHKKTED